MSDQNYWQPDSEYPISADQLGKLEPESQKAVMREWFFRNYEDPAESTPYETAEGGYIYIWGGPYDAREELSSEFSEFVQENVIEEMVEELETQSLQWTGKARAFERHVAKTLQDANIPFETELSIGGIRPDFIIEAPNGKRIILETKSKLSDKRSAIEQAGFYKRITGADDVYMVIPLTEASRPSEGIISVGDLVDTLLKSGRGPRASGAHPVPPVLKMDRTVFAAMPFSPGYEDVYFVAMAPASEVVNAVCERVDQEKFSGDVVDEIKRLIRASKAVIADLSEGKPNVLYEVGFAHALGRPTIHVCSTPLDQLPFDVRNWNTIKYIKGQTHKLKDELIQQLKAIPDLQ